MVNRPVQSPSSSVPPLTNGDRLTRHEFERRYAHTDVQAELIEGTVYMPPAALRFRSHAKPHGFLITWLGLYQAFTPGVELGIEPTVRLDLDNEFQPDGVLLIAGGQAKLTSDDYIEGPPELVVEIAASSVAIDLYAKKNAYRRNGVQEYIVWQAFENKLNWFYLEEGNYGLAEPDAAGVIKSRVFPGLWLAVAALQQGQMQTVLATAQQGIAAPEHQAFVQRLGQPEI
ncbi:Uma2 family endonuclease [Sphaerothrix gracilis]|uniref:Uma2 family endonuclease n=1 Tax=Sphaerothrix gracilis TaxID=3151835 RepID=UPI0031FCCB49